MLLGLIFIGILMYLAFYFAFSSYTSSNTAHSGTAISVYEKVQDALFKMPASLPLAIIKVFLVLALIYGIYDLATSTMRRTRLRRDQKQRKDDLHRQLRGPR